MGLSLATWLVSRGRGRRQGHSPTAGASSSVDWAPTFFALGIALKHEEADKRRPQPRG